MAATLRRVLLTAVLAQVASSSSGEVSSEVAAVASTAASVVGQDEVAAEVSVEVQAETAGQMEGDEMEAVVGHLRGSTEALAEVMATCSGVSQRSSSFEKAMQQCAVKTFAVQPAAGKCMQSSMGVSASCGKCLGDVLKCSRDYCAQICCGGKCGLTGNCKSCVRAKCAGHFSTCGI